MPGAIVYGNALSQQSPLARGTVGFWIGLPGLSAGPKLWDYSRLRNHLALPSGQGWAPGVAPGFGAVRSSWAAAISTGVNTSGPLTIVGRVRRTADVGGGNDFAWLAKNKSGLDVGFELYLGNVYASPANKTRLSIRGYVGQTAVLYCGDAEPVSNTATNFDLEAASASVVGEDLLIAATFTDVAYTNAMSIGTMSADLEVFGYWNRVLPAGEVAGLFDQARRGFPDVLRRVRPWVYVGDAGGDVSVNLSGQAVTCSAGTIASAISYALSSSAATCSAGTITNVASYALTGSGVTSSAGTLSPEISYALTGQAVTSSAGTIVSAISYGLSGSAVTCSAGTIINAVSYSITGSEVTTASGTIVPTINYTITGQGVTTAAGTLVAAINYALTGSVVTCSAGTITVNGDLTIALTGSEVTCSAGTITTTVSYTLDGTVATVTAGTITHTASFALAGTAVTCDAGTLTTALTYALFGESVAITAGTIVQGVVFSLSGEVVATATGTLGVSLSITLSSATVTCSAGTITVSGGTTVGVYGGTWTRSLPTWNRVVTRNLPNWVRVWSYTMTRIDPLVLTVFTPDERYFLFDYSTSPEIQSGDTISSAQILGGTGLTIGTPVATATEIDGIPAGEAVIVRMEGWTEGETYNVACVATMSSTSKLTIPGELYCSPWE